MSSQRHELDQLSEVNKLLRHATTDRISFYDLHHDTEDQFVLLDYLKFPRIEPCSVNKKGRPAQRSNICIHAIQDGNAK